MQSSGVASALLHCTYLQLIQKNLDLKYMKGKSVVHHPLSEGSALLML